MSTTAARRASDRHLLSEVLQHDVEPEGVRFVNPFEPTNDRLVDEIGAAVPKREILLASLTKHPTWQASS